MRYGLKTLRLRVGNGNGTNGSANGNGKSAAHAEVTMLTNGAAEKSSNGASKETAPAVITISRPASSNGNGKLPAVLGIPEQITVAPNADFSQIEGLMDPCEAGQLDTCAIEREWDTSTCRVTEMEAAAAGPGSASSAATPPETPYSTPGGRWGKFKKYSVWQRTLRDLELCVVILLQIVAVRQKVCIWEKGYDAREGESAEG
eukprot:jgi/Botrbrau1/1516/Bobra.0107s0004.1